MMKEMKQLEFELERVDKLSGGFPLPSIDTTTDSPRKQIPLMESFRQVWLQTPPELQKEVLSQRLEKDNMVKRPKRLVVGIPSLEGQDHCLVV